MKYTMLLLAGSVLVLAACSGQDQTVTQALEEGTVDMAPVQETADEAVPEEASVADAITESAAVAETAAGTFAAGVEVASGEMAAVAAAATTAADSAVPVEPPSAELVEPEPVHEPVPAAATDSAAGPDLAVGESIYTSHCFACHGSGVAGAPKLGDTASWAPRIAQGLDAMTDHAINGFQGSGGYMPPRGGYSALTDAEVAAAVAYMAAQGH